MSVGAGVLGAFVPGLCLMVFVFIGGHISLGSYNPAVTLALALRNTLSWRAFIPYVLAELFGGVIGALMAHAFLELPVIPSQGAGFTLAHAFFAELFGAFALVSAVLNAGTSADYEGNSFFGEKMIGVLIFLK